MMKPDLTPFQHPHRTAPARAALRWPIGLLVVCLALWVPGFGAAGSEHGRTNRLIHSADPYLQMHAHNPVDWYPWGPEAIAKARRENKLIFLSIGYSTCYWCHVADRTLFSDPAIARLMNRWFVNVIVDREQRPDVDQVYMLATEIMNGRGGWPNNLFLTPDLKPFFAGSYFPPASDEFGRPGFPSILRMIHGRWINHRSEVIAKANLVYTRMKQVDPGGPVGGAAPVHPRRWLAKARKSMQARFDWKYGGIPNGTEQTKSPREPMLYLWLTDARLAHNPKAMEMLRSTLDAMAFGGLHDQLGGGFHRYSSDRRWSIPHFEKMLYDNAQLLDLYARAYALTGDPLYRSVALDTGGYLRREMASPGGGFYTARDAQVNGVEGASYTWTRRKIVSVLGKAEAERFFEVYALTPISNPTSEQELNDRVPEVLRVRIPIATTLQRAGYRDTSAMFAALRPAREKLLAVRERRAQPAIDRKIVVSLNGLAIGAFAHASKILDRPAYLALATRAANRIWLTAYTPRTGALEHEIYRGRARIPGFLDDYALLGNGFLELYQATGQVLWRRRAEALARDITTRFLRKDGTLATAPAEKDLLIPPRDHGDNHYPSGTSATVALLQRLGAATGDARYDQTAWRILQPLSARVAAQPGAWSSLVAFLAAHPIPGTARAAAKPTNASATPAFRVPDSADYVHASARETRSSGVERIIVTLRIDPGYHVNANPASFPYLIPTTVHFDGLTPSRVLYPEAVRITPAFAKQGLDVYEGVAHIRVEFPAGILRHRRMTIRGTARVQACTDQICLPPATLPLKVGGARAAH